MPAQKSLFNSKNLQNRQTTRKIQKKICKHKDSPKNQNLLKKRNAKQEFSRTLAKLNLPEILKKNLSNKDLCKFKLKDLKIEKKISVENMSNLVMTQQRTIENLLRQNNTTLQNYTFKTPTKLQRRQTSIQQSNLFSTTNNNLKFQTMFDENSLSLYQLIQNDNTKRQLSKSLKDPFLNI